MKKRPAVSASLLASLLGCFLALAACQEGNQPTEQVQALPQRPPEPAAPKIPANSPTPPSTAHPAADLTHEAAVLAIRREFSRINAAPLDSVKRPFRCDTDGTVTFYSEKGQVVKILINWGFLGDGSTVSEYYYQAGKLIFFYETYTGGPAGEPETTNDERIYVQNDKAIRFLKNQRPAPCSPCAFSRSSRPYRVLAAFRSGQLESALCRL
ncbi:hypothetical protein [Hymenobacter sediminicola]|uniref:Lipoprotein n=1 Tax=Hymenobacter sediminicola TaxID=2761579 RepID=A0A7G7W8R0_9BACT|nr:hypothetical protein [Hymenobacter sediminicola]QNH62753.1 hypothetical protein H4317_02715 [Hymenobacter sediminicola]